MGAGRGPPGPLDFHTGQHLRAGPTSGGGNAANVCLIIITLWERFCGNRRRPSGILCRGLPARRVVFAGDNPQRYKSAFLLSAVAGVGGPLHPHLNPLPSMDRRQSDTNRPSLDSGLRRGEGTRRRYGNHLFSYESLMPAGAGIPRYEKRELWFGTANRHGGFC